MFLCHACVLARGLERGDAAVRVAVDQQIGGACDDCGLLVQEPDTLEAWRPLAAPLPSFTLPVFPNDERDEP